MGGGEATHLEDTARELNSGTKVLRLGQAGVGNDHSELMRWHANCGGSGRYAGDSP